jgi:hypothetical protein
MKHSRGIQRGPALANCGCLELLCPQPHLFEDRVMKIDRVDVGSKVYLGPRSAVLYSARVGDNARLGPLRLVMKGEHIPAATSWVGLPATPLRAAR